MERIKNIVRRIFRPGKLWSLPIGIVGIALLSFVFIAGLDNTLIGIVSYPISLYALIVLGIGFPDISRTTKALIARNKYGERYISDRELRAKVSLYQGLFVNLLFAAFYVFSSGRYASLWFGAVAAYYIILSVMRFILLRNVRRAMPREKQIRTYRACGSLMFVLNLGMMGMIVQMVLKNVNSEYSTLMIYTSAVYTFYYMIVAIINIFRFRKMDNPVLSAAKMLSFAGAIMSMFTLQTVMLSHYGTGTNTQFVNALFGGVVFLAVLLMAILMVVRSNREIKIICK
jgi:hypothetical protein